MANTLTAVLGDLYKAAEIVGREQIGFIPSVVVNADSTQRVAQGGTIDSFFTPEPTVNSSATPAMTIPEGDDQTISAKQFAVSQVASVRIPWTGEEIKGVNNTYGFSSIYGNQVLQAMRKISNQIEAYLGTTLKNGSSRALGTAGTAPFGSNLNVVASARQVLKDNGTPEDGQWTMVIDSNAGVNMRNITNLIKVNEAGTDATLRRGTLLNLSGFDIRESAGVAAHTKGTATGLDPDNSDAIGVSTIALDGGDGGSLLPGDVVTFATADGFAYVVNSGFTATSGNMVIGEPGLKEALTAGEEMTIGDSYTANLFFHRQAAELVVRPLALPNGGDAAEDSVIVQDPISGLVYEIRLYKGYRKMMADVTVLYDAKVWLPEFIGTLMG